MTTSQTHTNGYPLWNGAPLPQTADIPLLDGMTFSVIKPFHHDVDGGHWLLGVALAWHGGKLYASYGFNISPHENTATEEARGCSSEDGGRSWGPEFVIAADSGNLGISHGVFLDHKGCLWSFNGAFYDDFRGTHTRAYRLNDATGQWCPKGVVVCDGFWPMQEPLRMADGNWIMSGCRAPKGYELESNWPVLPAVAISCGDDMTQWEMVVIRPQSGLDDRIWGESTVYIHADRIFNVARWGGKARALVAVSDDCGRTWTKAIPSNLNMNTSKPYTGTLSTGEHYLIGATAADCVNQRNVLTLALTQPGEIRFSRVFVIRHAVFPEGPGTSNPSARLSYPYAIERAGNLYVGYADKNEPSAELAIVPLAQVVQ